MDFHIFEQATLWKPPTRVLFANPAAHIDASELETLQNGLEEQPGDTSARGRMASDHRISRTVARVHVTTPLMLAASVIDPILGRITQPPRPWDGPMAFLGWTYCSIFAFRWTETFMLRSPWTRETELRKRYLSLHGWLSRQMSLEVPRTREPRPHSTVCELFMQDLAGSLNSPDVRKPTFTQIVLPAFMHFDPIHALGAVNFVWGLTKLSHKMQFRFAALMIGSSVVINFLQWKLAKATLFSLPPATQNVVAIQRQREYVFGQRAGAISALKRSILRGSLSGIVTSLKTFVRQSWRASQLSLLWPGIGASGGTNAAVAFVYCLNGARTTIDISSGILGPLSWELAYDYHAALPFALFIAKIGRRTAFTLGRDYPNMKRFLFPTWRQSLIVVTLCRVGEYVLALSPHVGHLAHLLGSALGALAAWFVAGV